MAMDAKEKINETLLFIYEYLREDMVQELILQGHEATGSLIKSIESKIEEGIDYIQMDVLFNEYGKYVDSGRRAGGKKVPIKALMDWIKVKRFVVNDKEAKGIAFAIQNKIFKVGISTPSSWKGTKTKDWLSKTLKTNANLIARQLDEAIGLAFDAAIDNMLREVKSRSKGNVTINI